MLKVISGPFSPALEEGFLSRIDELKSDPLTPIAVMTPSSRQMDRLQKLISARRPSLMNVHFHNFISLAQNLIDEDGGSAKPVLSDPLFFDTLVKILLREKKPFHIFEEMAVPDGFPPAVRSTLRDLLDASVDDELVQNAMAEKFVGRDVDLGSLRELLSLYRSYLEKLESLPVSSTAQIVKRATELAPESQRLKSFKEIMFYGFYDLTGLQTEFFEAIVRHYPSSFFFPYVAQHPAYAFAKRFRDNVLQRIEFDEELNEEEPSEIKPSIFNVSGNRDEAWLIAREILRLKEQGTAFSDIAVIARTRTRLEGPLPTLLREWQIPFSTTAKTPVSRRLPAKMVLDLLVLAGAKGIPLKRFEFTTSADFGEVKVEELFNKTRGWPSMARWSEHSKQLLSLIDDVVKPSSQEGRILWDRIKQCVESLSSFNTLGLVSIDDFADALRQRFEKTSSPEDDVPLSGVSLLHAEAARGLSFKAVLLIGLEEKVFPRIIREDPFLRDDARTALRDTVGYKIGQKLSALEEERLLFHLLSTSAKERLIFIYQRSDDEGKVAGESSFLRSYMSVRGFDLEKEVVSIPRPTFEKLKNEKLSLLGKKEVVMTLLHKNHEKEAVEYLKQLNENTTSFVHGLFVQKQLHKFDAPTGFDGLVGPVEISTLSKRGTMSPTTLETYGRCPYQFFATKILMLEPLESRRDLFQMPPDKKGTSLHAFLETFFKIVTNDGTRPAPPSIPADVFQKVFDETVPVTLGAEWEIPPVLWKALRLELREELKSYLEKELPILTTEGLIPSYFELKWTGSLPSPVAGEMWHGEMDRVDVGNGRAVVVDYKTGKIPTKKIETEAIRGRRAQPPLYLLMADAFFKEKGQAISELDFSYHQIGKKEERKTFSAEEWKEAQSAILETTAQQLSLISAGNFLIYPDTEPGSSDDRYCGFCDVADICRKNHSLSAYRARQGPGQEMTEIRTKKKPHGH